MTNNESKSNGASLDDLRARIRALETPGVDHFTQFAVDHLADATYWIQEDGSIIYVNEAASRLLGYSMAELCSMKMLSLNVHIDGANWPAIWGLLKASKRRVFEARHRHKDGHVIDVEVVANFFCLDGKEYSCAFVRDITERKELEKRLRHSEKMDAVGRLAGGVAHDFNNQLAGIQGYAELIRLQGGGNPELLKLVSSQCEAIDVAAELTAGLLAFSCRGKFRSEPVDLHGVIQTVVAMLSHGLDKRVVVDVKLGADRSYTLGDPSQLQSAVLNLALNARDAMRDGGEIAISTCNVDFSKSSEGGVPEGLSEGPYVALSVHDTGTGIDSATLERVFEPFFTTKDPVARSKGKGADGTGTGLGLAAVYGTLKNHAGAVSVDSELGKGSLFTLHLPVIRASAVPRIEQGEPPGMRLHGRVLFVDDEAAVRNSGAMMMEALGCTVFSCADGAQAVACFREHQETIDLILLDLVMPKQSGAALFAELMAIDPRVQVILVSGYSQEGEAQALLDAGAKGFLQKPFTMVELASQLQPFLQR